VSRWNEYQFLVLLPETDVNNAATVAKRLKIRMNQLSVEVNEGTFKTCALYGIVGFTGDQAKKELTVDRLLEFARQALDTADPETLIGGIKLA